MRGLRDRLVPAVAALVLVGVAVATLGLLNSARDHGLRALEDAKAAEIERGGRRS